MTTELKSQNDSKLDPQTQPVNLCTVKGERKKLPTHHSPAPSKPNVKLKRDKPSHPNNPGPKHKQVAQLIGKKCLVWCKMNSVKTQALWDTGAQVSIMSETWKSQNLPDARIRPISDLLSDDELLDLRAANGTEIPFQGWVPVSFSLCDPKAKQAKSDEVLVPVLVSRDILQRPIIGFNAIEEMLINREDQAQPSESIALLRNSLKLGSGKAEVLLNVIQGTTNENVTYQILLLLTEKLLFHSALKIRLLLVVEYFHSVVLVCLLK